MDTVAKGKSCSQNQDPHGINDLITNLDHELFDVRVRALKCLLAKLEYSIISSECLSERVDLLHRLAEWLRTESGRTTSSAEKLCNTRSKFHWSADDSDAIPLIVDLLYRLSQHESFRRLIVTEKVDSLLTELRPKTGGDLRPLIDRLLDLVCTGSFNVAFSESPKRWNDNRSGHSAKTSISTPSCSPRFLHPKETVEYFGGPFSSTDRASATEMEPVNSKDLVKWTKNCHFGIYKTVLEKTDRRLLSSTVESLLSKNEPLVFMTISFVRDVLLNDFPAEIFVQEVSLTLSILEVACQKWDDSRIEAIAAQAFLKLSTLLRQRFAFMNSSEFYQFQSLKKKKSASRYNGSDSNVLGVQALKNGDTDYFINNQIQILKEISRAILFNSDGVKLWILMENFSFTLSKCSSCFPVDSKNLAMSLQEVLLDLTHCYDKNSEIINTPALALTLSSILQSLHANNEVFIVANDVRRVFKKLSCCPRLFHHWAQVYQHFLHYVSPFDSTLEPATKHMELVCKGLEEICNVLDLSKEIDMTAETFLFAKESIPYLAYIESEQSLNNFIERTLALCTNPMFTNLLPNAEERLPVVLQLMAHSSDAVRRIVYSSIRNLVKTHFGPGRNPSKANEENVALSLILNREFIKEVLHFGLRDSVTEVQHFGEEIILFLIKCKAAVGRDVWEKVFSRLTSFMCILESQADPQTVIGKAVLKLCDPMSNDHGLDGHELLCSNLRLLYSCNSRVREEASDRLMKILCATETGSVTFRYASYSNYTLANIFNVGRSLDMSEISSSKFNDQPNQGGKLLKHLEICREEDLEPNVRKNSLVKLSILLEDFRYHEAFTRQEGVELVVDMIAKVASEKDYKYSLDMWPPAVRILKLVSIRSGPCRKVLLSDKEVLINLSCGMFSLRADDRFRCEIVHLVSLILFHNFFRISENGEKCFLPQTLLIRCRIPIAAEPYLASSAYTTSAETVSDVDNKKTQSFGKYPMENIFKSWWTFGRNQNGDKKNLAEDTVVLKAAAAFKKKKEKVADTKLPKEKIVVFLSAVQNASDHSAVVVAIDQIWENVFPLILNTRSNGDFLDYVCAGAPWRDSFYRFLSVEPTCSEDEELLIQVLELCKFLVTNVKESSLITSWIVPLCLEKGCACLRLMLENSTKNQYGTMVPSILRSLMDIYNVLLTKHESLVAEHVGELFNTLCKILHGIAEDGYSNSALLHPVLHNLSVLYTYSGIIELLAKNNPLSMILLYENAKAVSSMQERSGTAGDSYRNRGVLHYASLSLLHLINIIIKQNKESAWDGLGKCIPLIPFLWVNRDSRIRAAGFQISQILTTSKDGTSMLFSCLESPASVWMAAYGALMDLQEVPVVKHKAAGLLLNLITSWPELKETGLLNQDCGLPNWNVVEDITNVVSNICWSSHMSVLFRVPANSQENNPSDDSSNAAHMITPKVLSSVGKLIIAMNCSDMEVFHPESFSRDVSSYGLCSLLFRVAGSHQLSTNMDVNWWLDSCFALSCVVEAIISLSQKDRSIAVILIGDKRNLCNLVQLLVIEAPSGSHKNKCLEVLSSLWINIFTLLSILCMDAGQNFEDLERNIWNQKNTIFLRLNDWLQDVALAKCRKVALTFTYRFLSMLVSKQSEKESSQGTHPVLCSEWRQRQSTYGKVLCESLRVVLENSMNVEEKLLVLNTLAALFTLSGTAKKHAIENNMVEALVEILQAFGLKYIDSGDVQYGKKNCGQWYDETVSVLTVLSVVFYGSIEAKEAALNSSIADTIHKIFKWWTFSPDRSLLHLFIETLLNFTEEFPVGSQSMTVTTNLVGIGPKKVATPQSLLHEILSILQADLDSVDKNPNLKTVDIIMSLLRNSAFVLECRTVLTKSGVPYFLKKLHVQEMKKWGPKQHHVKSQFLGFLVHVTVHPDMQIFVAKIPECLDILISLISVEQTPTSSMALRILRNLSFNPANRARFLCENGLMLALSGKLRTSENLEEIESAAVGLWALIANSEKGKLSAKRASCPDGINKAIIRVRKLEQRSNDLSSEKRDLSTLLNLLGSVNTLLCGSNNGGSSQSVNA